MSIPKEPRQQMINMMYLVLTALLALNVSKEVLNAFQLVNEGLANSTKSVVSKRTSLMKDFSAQMKNDKAKTKPYYEKAQKATKLANGFSTYIDSLQKQLVKESGGRTKDGALVDKKNLDVATRIMVKKGKGEQLKDTIQYYRNQFSSLLSKDLGFDQSDRNRFQSKIALSASWDSTETNKKTWAAYNFRMVPVTAAVTILSKFQNDIRNTETIAIEELYKQIKAGDHTFSSLQAQVDPSSSYVLQGESYEADIFVSASSETQNPDVFIGPLKGIAKNDNGDVKYQKLNENPLKRVKDTLPVNTMGKGEYEKKATTEGIKSYTGAIRVKSPDGSGYEYHPFEKEYRVSKPAVTVSPVKLNVLYAGIDNPLSISAAGFPSEDVTATISGGLSLNKTSERGIYETNPPGSKLNERVKVSVSVKKDDGGRKTLGNKEFRVRRVPDPIAAIKGDITGGKVDASVLKGARGVNAVLEDFEFEGIQFKVKSYQFLYIPQRKDPRIYENNGWKFSGDIKSALSKIKPGDRINFRYIKAKGPGGSTRELNSIALEVK